MEFSFSPLSLILLISINVSINFLSLNLRDNSCFSFEIWRAAGQS